MTPISAAELAGMRAGVGELFPDTCTILSVSRVPDGFGGNVETWGTATASVACRADKLTGSEGIIGAARQPFAGYVFSMAYTVTVTPAHRILFNGDTYAVTSVNTDQSWQIVKRVLAEAVLMATQIPGVILDTSVLDKMTAEMKPNASKIVRRYGMAATASAMLFAPVETGALKASVGSESGMEGDLTYTLRDGVEYGVFQELGTSKMAAHPFITPAIEKIADGFLAAFAELFK